MVMRMNMVMNFGEMALSAPAPSHPPTHARIATATLFGVYDTVFLEGFPRENKRRVSWKKRRGR